MRGFRRNPTLWAVNNNASTAVTFGLVVPALLLFPIRADLGPILCQLV